MTADKAAAIGTGIDTGIERIGLSFDAFGRLSETISYTDSAGTTAANAAKFTYSPLWQVAKVYQDHDSEVTHDGSGNPTGNTQVLTYTYATTAVAAGTGGGNYSRVTNMQRPYGTNEQIAYGTAGSTSDRISRAGTLSYQRGGGGVNAFAAYAFVGLDMPAVVEYPKVDMALDRTLASDGKRRAVGYTTGTVGVYPGWDRFGRVVLHSWADDALTTNGGNPYPNLPPFFQESATHDKSGNKLTRFDAHQRAS